MKKSLILMALFSHKLAEGFEKNSDYFETLKEI